MLPRFATLLAGLGFTGLAQAAATHYPLTVDNCGKPQVFAQAPQRAVTIGQAGTELLYALGLGDKLAGTSLWFNNVLPEYQAVNARCRAWPTTTPASRRWSASARNWSRRSSNGWSVPRAWSPPASSSMS